jgi:hypothetical protein
MLFIWHWTGGNDFNAGNIRYEGHWKGRALKSRLRSLPFQGPKKSWKSKHDYVRYKLHSLWF